MRDWIKLGTKSDIEFEYFDLRDDHFPTNDEEEKFDLFMITGSPNSVYDDVKWIRKLEDLIRRLDEKKKNILGICFGHQVVASALGGVVSKNPKGWEFSVCPFKLKDEVKPIFGKEEINLIYSHQDIVEKLPEGVQNLGGNELTEYQGFIKGNHILTLQGHPEFNSVALIPILKKNLNLGRIDQSYYDDSMDRLSKETDSLMLAKFVFKFFGLENN